MLGRRYLIAAAWALHDMVVWDSEGTGLIEFDANSLSLDALGYIVESTVSTDALVNRVNQTPNITIQWDTWLAQLDFNELT